MIAWCPGSSPCARVPSSRDLQPPVGICQAGCQAPTHAAGGTVGEHWRWHNCWQQQRHQQRWQRRQQQQQQRRQHWRTAVSVQATGAGYAGVGPGSVETGARWVYYTQISHGCPSSCADREGQRFGLGKRASHLQRTSVSKLGPGNMI